jgi:aliphatic sulfonates family ABC transporter substrate-binding protein
MNCGALANSLIESELFGHEKGAFTGAITSKAGWFETASGGTLFLDEIGDLPLAMQVKLLRVLQEGEVVRVGARHPTRVDVRLIAATNVSLEEAVAAGHFREDLFYRLNVAALALPPLRARPGDVLPLTRYFVDFYRQRLGLPPIEISPAASQRLLQHPWPGNIRELENAVHHALLVCRDGVIAPSDLRLTLMSGRTKQDGSAGSASASPLDALESALRGLFEAGLPDLWDSIERSVMTAAYDHCERNQVQTARLLGISRNVVRARLLEYGEIPGSVRPPPAASAMLEPSIPRPAPLPSKPCVRIGYQRFGLLPLVKSQGGLDRAFARLGFEVEWIEFPGGIQMVEAFQASELALGGVGEGPPVFAQAAEVPFVYVAAEAPAPEDEALVVRADSSIRSVRELAGKRVALNRGANVHYLLIRALEEVGLDYEDVEVSYLAPNEARSAFDRGEIDAWAIWAPLLRELVLSGSARVLRDASGLADNAVFYIAGRRFAAQHPDLVDAFFGELESAPAAFAPHRVPRRADESLFERQQAVADTFHRHKLIARAISVRAVHAGGDASAARLQYHRPGGAPT